MERKSGLPDIEFLSKSQLIEKIQEYQKLLSLQATRLRKAKRNLQSQREQINGLNNEVRRLKLENKHLQTILIRETEGKEQQDLIEMLINDFREERKNTMSLEHSLMETKWELTDKIEDFKELSEQTKERDKRYKTEMELIRIQIQDLEARQQRNQECITKRDSCLMDAKESVLELEDELQEKDQIIEDLKDELHDREKIIQDTTDKLEKSNSTRKVSVSKNTIHDVQEATPRPSLSSVRWAAQVMVKNIIYLQKNLY